MQKFIALLLTLVVISQTIYQGLVYTYYTLNKAYIAENLCENKAKPEILCSGKCYLNKLIEIDTQEEQPTPPQLEDLRSITLFCEPTLKLQLANIRSEAWLGKSTSNKLDQQQFYEFLYITSPFRPPIG